MAKRTNSEDPVFIVKFQRGLADRHRLPLEHVLSSLTEVRHMLTEAGREVQRAHGHKDPDGDFGLELIAGESGTAFLKGSLESRVAITMDKANGVLTANLVLDTVEGLSTGKLVPAPGNIAEAQIIRRLTRIAKIQRSDKIDTQFTLKTPDQRQAKRAVFGESAVAYANTLTEEEFTEESVTVFGKLVKLEDRDFEDEGGKAIYGGLRRDNGEVWRIQFRSADRTAASDAFGQQVQVALTGTVSYYRVATPKMMVDLVETDQDRDLEAGFDELFGCDRELYGGADLDSLLEEIRG